MELLDIKGRNFVKGSRVCVQEDIQTENGTLPMHSIVEVSDFNEDTEKIEVKKNGESWWIESNQVSCSFL